MFHLAGSDAECESTEGSMRAGVGVAAHDGHARLRQPHLGTNNVHDALLDVPERIQRDTELCAVLSQCFDLRARDWIGDRLVHIDSGNVVIFRGHREIRTTHRSAGSSKTVEGLRAGHLVHQMQVDVQQIRLTVGRPDDVVVPHLLGQSATHYFLHVTSRVTFGAQPRGGSSLRSKRKGPPLWEGPCSPDGIRTRATALRGRRARPLHNGAVPSKRSSLGYQDSNLD